MIIVTTPMCENIVKLAGINQYKVNKNPDNEEGDLAILLSENKVKMNCLNIKLNTFSQIKESIIRVSKYSSKGEISKENVDKIFSEYNIPEKWIKKNNYNIKVKVYSNFLKEIVEDFGFKINDKKYDYVIFPDYLKEKIAIEPNVKLIEIPTHSNISKDPIKRAILRYSILEDMI